jgi:endonuclease III
MTPATSPRARAPRRAVAWKPPTRARVLRVRDRLREVYGVPLMVPHRHPIAELVLTVLSQSTNDRNRDVAFLRLRTRFPSWHAVRDAPVAEIEEAIRPGGISKVKSVRIQAILRAISDTPAPGRDWPARAHDSSASGRDASADALADERSPDARSPDELSLDWLPDVALAHARDYLVALPGVGRKTAACVLLFAYGLRDVPVDTHVSRVGARLRLLEDGAPFERMHDQMLALTPPGQELELHVNLLRHGRRTCHARSPECGSCALARMCPSRALFT